MNTQRYTVNVRVGGIGSPRVAVSQGDIGRHLVFNLFDGAVAFAMTSGTTATIVGRKPSGLGFTETCTLDGGNSVSVRTTEAMTQEAGKIPAELRISDGTKVIGTANFVFYVEPSPHPDGTTDGTLETMDDIQTQIGDLSDLTTSDKSSLVGAINEAAQSGGSEVVIDATLTQSGQAADAKATGDEISGIKADLDSLGDGVPAEVRQALLTLFQSAAYAETGLTDEIAVIESWAAVVTAISLNQSSISISGASTSQLVATTTPAGGTVTWASSDTSVATVSSSGLITGVGNGSCTITASCGGKTATCSVAVSGFISLTGITATYTQSGTVYDTDTLDSLKSDLVVTALMSDQTTSTLNDADYTLSGTLAEGTSTITVTYGGKTTTFNVTVTAAPTLTSISAVYTQSGTVYDTASLDSLKSDLVVTANYSDSTTSTLSDSDYTLSGTLTVGTSTITVSYSGKTATFNVTVADSSAIQVTYTQGSIGGGNTDADRVSGVIESSLHFGDGETYVITVPDGYSVVPFGFAPNSDQTAAGTKGGSAGNILNTYVVSDSSYVVPRIADMNGTLYANTKSLNNLGSAGWMTGTITYTFTKTGQYGYTFTGLGFGVKKNDDANITPSDIEPLITINKVEASS